MKILAAIALLALGACATQPRWQWAHPTADRPQAQKDYGQCEYEAASATASYSSNTRMRTSLGQSLSDGIDRGKREGELIVLCMKTKGYYQQPIN